MACSACQPTKRREDRLEIRLTPKAKSMLKRAASVERKTVSAFILDKALAAAAETLADRREFRLSAKQYDAFPAALDAPVKPPPRLEQLSAQTHVLAQDLRVPGYYGLPAGSVTPDETTERVRKGQTRHPIPVILLARLAVDASAGGKGLGAALLKDALMRTAQAAHTIGARALLVHAKDDSARTFCEHFAFESSPSDPYHLLLITKDLLRIIGQ